MGSTCEITLQWTASTGAAKCLQRLWENNWMQTHGSAVWEAFQALQLSRGPSHAIENPSIFLGSSLYKLFLLLGTFPESVWLLLSVPFLHSFFSSFSPHCSAFPPCSWGLFSGACSEMRMGSRLRRCWGPPAKPWLHHAARQGSSSRRTGQAVAESSSISVATNHPKAVFG